MSIQVHDRLGAINEARSGATLLGRFALRGSAPGELFMNSFPACAGMFVVPESSGRWHLLQAAERVDGTFARAPMLEPLDVASIRKAGRSLGESVDQGRTWLDVLDISPLVPDVSDRAEVQRFEHVLKEQVGHLEEVCRRPRTHLRIDVERMAVSRARRFPAQAANYLAAHTEDWERPTLRSVVPKRILATVREVQYDIYENRVAVRLVDHLVAYLRLRVHEVTRLLRMVDESDASDGDVNETKKNKKRRTEVVGTYLRQQRVSALWGASFDVARLRETLTRTLGQLKHLLFTVSGLKDSVLYREVPRRATVGTTLTMTNILSDDAHYRRVAELWLEWARLAREQAVRPRAYFEEMQDLCRSFDSFALLLTIRALDQLGFEPTNLEKSLSDGELEIRRGLCVARLSWATVDGAISLQGGGVGPLRIIPLCSSLAALDDEPLRRLLADADANADADTTTVIVYPSAAEGAAFEHLAPELAARLRSLAHEVGRLGRRGVGFLPVSPWDIGSVERMARQLRWATTAPAFLAYPPTIDQPELIDLSRGYTWLEVAGNQLRITRAPLENDVVPVKRFVDDAAAQLKQLEEERENVSLKLREVVRHRGATGAVNARKKELNAEITDAERRLEALRRFERDLTLAVGVVDELLGCPTCHTRADARRDFKSMGQHFSCTCSDCSTTWGTIACSRCSSRIPFLRLVGTAWTKQAGSQDWVDRTLGADVLALPIVVNSEVRFACPCCGEGAADALEGVGTANVSVQPT